MAKRGRKANPLGEKVYNTIIKPLRALPQYDPPLNDSVISGLLNHFGVPTLSGSGKWSSGAVKRLETRYGGE